MLQFGSYEAWCLVFCTCVFMFYLTKMFETLLKGCLIAEWRRGCSRRTNCINLYLHFSFLINTLFWFVGNVVFMLWNTGTSNVITEILFLPSLVISKSTLHQYHNLSEHDIWGIEYPTSHTLLFSSLALCCFEGSHWISAGVFCLLSCQTEWRGPETGLGPAGGWSPICFISSATGQTQLDRSKGSDKRKYSPVFYAFTGCMPNHWLELGVWSFLFSSNYSWKKPYTNTFFLLDYS